MTNADDQLQRCTRTWLHQYRKHCTHAVTLTLKQATWISTEKGRAYIALTPQLASRTLRHALNRLNRKLYGNGCKRKPAQCQLLVIATLEGQRFSKRLHYHLQLGNIPAGIADDELREAITEAWHTTDFGDTEIDVQALFGTHWLNYITKEIGTNGTDCIDWDNTNVPESLLQD